MNIIQRIVLIAGAIVFVVVLLTAPKYSILPSRFGNVIVEPDSYGRPVFTDSKTAIVRGFAVLGATFLLFFALKSRRKDYKKASVLKQQKEVSQPKRSEHLDDADEKEEEGLNDLGEVKDAIEDGSLLPMCDLIELAKSRQLTLEPMKSQTRDLETIFHSDKFEVSMRECNECYQQYIYCFREYTVSDERDDYWMFWIPVEDDEIDEVKHADVLMKYMGELLHKRSHICWRPDGRIVWNENGFHLALTVFLP